MLTLPEESKSKMAELELEQLKTQSLELRTALAREQEMSTKAAKQIELLAQDQKYEINVNLWIIKNL